VAKAEYVPVPVTKTFTRSAFIAQTGSTQTKAEDDRSATNEGLGLTLALGLNDADADMLSEALGDAEADGLAEAEGERDNELEALGDSDADGLREADGDRLSESNDKLELAEGDNDADSEALGLIEADGDSEADGEMEADKEWLTDVLRATLATLVKFWELLLVTLLMRVLILIHVWPSIVPSTVNSP